MVMFPRPKIDLQLDIQFGALSGDRNSIIVMLLETPIPEHVRVRESLLRDRDLVYTWDQTHYVIFANTVQAEGLTHRLIHELARIGVTATFVIADNGPMPESIIKESIVFAETMHNTLHLRGMSMDRRAR